MCSIAVRARPGRRARPAPPRPWRGPRSAHRRVPGRRRRADPASPRPRGGDRRGRCTRGSRTRRCGPGARGDRRADRDGAGRRDRPIRARRSLSSSSPWISRRISWTSRIRTCLSVARECSRSWYPATPGTKRTRRSSLLATVTPMEASSWWIRTCPDQGEECASRLPVDLSPNLLNGKEGRGLRRPPPGSGPCQSADTSWPGCEETERSPAMLGPTLQPRNRRQASATPVQTSTEPPRRGQSAIAWPQARRPHRCGGPHPGPQPAARGLAGERLPAHDLRGGRVEREQRAGLRMPAGGSWMTTVTGPSGRWGSAGSMATQPGHLALGARPERVEPASGVPSPPPGGARRSGAAPARPGAPRGPRPARPPAAARCRSAGRADRWPTGRT